jgi:hypothetical protein
MRRRPGRADETDSEWHDHLLADVQRQRTQRENSYRAHALTMLPPICAHCGREFGGLKVRELTVHHKDHNHENNPPDGSNWELLCLYCHENEHGRRQVADAYDPAAHEAEAPAVTSRPFAGLDKLLKKRV